MFKEIIISNKLNNRETEFYLFFIGIFLLPSALSISAIFLFIAFFLNTIKRKNNYLKDSWNIPFIICGSFMLISTFAHFFFIKSPAGELWDPTLSIIGLFNWIPFFWIFWSVQPFINCELDRKIFAYLLIAGSFPVLITGILQYFFNLHGQFELFKGLVTWYQKPIDYWPGLTGLFSNPNYTGAWLNIVWPFSIASIFLSKKKKVNILFSLIFLISISICLILTNSRNAWGGLILAIPLVVGINSFFWLIPLILLIGIIIVLTTFNYFEGSIQEYLRKILPKQIWSEFTQEGFIGMDISRIGIWKYAISFISYSPIFGYGAASFPIIFELKTGFWKGHTHNILLDIANSYGIPASLILFTTILSILIFSWKKIYLKDFENNDVINYFERSWWASFFILSISQLVDIQYFDGRISIGFWILLAGLKNIISKEKKIIK